MSLHPIADTSVYFDETSVQAHHADTPPCTDLSMVPEGAAATEPVNSPAADGRVEGPSDAGTFDFNALGHDSQACLEGEDVTRLIDTPAGPVEVLGQFVKGWVWNSNLGLVSFSCINGDNLGSSCGDARTNYGVYARESADGGDPRVMGFAWSDAVGWISMGCENGENTGAPCDAQAYGVRVALSDGTVSALCQGSGEGGTLNTGDLYGAAWNAGVGWMNVCGAHVELMFLEDIVADVAVEQVPVDQNGDAVDPRFRAEGNIVYADGEDYYEIIVELKDGNGRSITPSPTRSVNIIPGGPAHTVKNDQVTDCGDNRNANREACAANGIVKGAFEWDGARDAYIGKITSTAPTSPTNTLAMNSMTIELRNPAARPEANLIKRIDVPVPQQEFIFLPAVRVRQIGAVNASGLLEAARSISAMPGGSQAIRVKIEKAGTAVGLPADGAIEIITQLYDCSRDYDFVFDENGNGSLTDSDGAPEDAPLTQEQHAQKARKEFPLIEKTGVCAQGREGLVDSITATLAQVGGGQRNENANIEYNFDTYVYAMVDIDQRAPARVRSTNALGIQTIIQYTRADGSRVRYFSTGVNDGSVTNQAARVTGNVRLNVVNSSSGGDDRISKSIGENAASKREPFYRAIQSVISTRTPGAFDADTPNTKLIRTAASDILYYRRAPNAGHPCTIVLKGPTEDLEADLSFDRDVTVVTEGCDVFIDRNVRGGRGKLGIIALEDLTMPRLSPRKGGNVFVCSQVTDVEAHMVLDNTLFSYPNDEVDCGGVDKSGEVEGYGLPVMDADAINMLRHQYTNVGLLISNNTFGGSVQTERRQQDGRVVKSPARFGDGTIAKTPVEIAQSKLFDLNFMRYAQTQMGGPGGRLECWADGVKMSEYFGQTCNVNNATIRSIVNIIYRAPFKSQPVFDLVK